MPRTRLYQNAAQKQAAYRARNALQKRLTVPVHRPTLERLQAAVRAAAAGGDPLGRACLAGSPDGLLTRLAVYFEGRTEERKGASHGR